MRFKINKSRPKPKRPRDESQYAVKPAKEERSKRIGRPSSFTPSKVRKLLAMLRDNKTQQECAAYFGVSQATISYQVKKSAS